MNKLLIVGIVLFLSVSLVSATLIGSVKDDKIGDISSDSIAWNIGFRDKSDIDVCKSYASNMDDRTLMKCYGFKEVN